MKRILWVGLLGLLLTGCSAQPTFETVDDMQVVAEAPQVQQVLLELPKEAQLQTAGIDSMDKLYLCDGYTVSVQIMEAGDLDKTLRSTTGYGREALTVMQTMAPTGECYQCVWATAGEGQTQVGRTCILDDGNYHYALTVLTPEKDSGALATQVQNLLDSFRIVDPSISTGS